MQGVRRVIFRVRTFVDLSRQLMRFCYPDQTNAQNAGCRAT